MEGEAVPVPVPVPVGDFQDWELLANSDSELLNSPNSSGKSTNFQEIEAESEGMIRSDYFSLETDGRCARTVVDGSEEGSVGSDNPSWIDPGPETRHHRRNSGVFWTDSGSDRSDERKLSDFDVKNELGLAEHANPEMGFQGIGELEDAETKEGKLGSLDGKFSIFEGQSELSTEENAKKQVGIEGFGETQNKDKDLAKFWSDSGSDGLGFGGVGKVNEGLDNLGESESGNVLKEENSRAVAAMQGKKLGGEEEKRNVVWWKVPFEVLRYCVFRVSPVWSFSLAAAVMGFVILGRRLYKMKRKTSTLQLKVTVDDKKVSQVMSRAARLNEAFSVVRRVPIVRPLLPATGVNRWPVMSLR